MGRKSKWEWRQFGKLQTCADIEDYFLGKEKGMEYEHSNYFHYTSLETIDKILDKQHFWLTSVCGFNDKLDTEQFGGDREDYFSLCFSTGINENLSLWYLYSGIDGKGGRLRITFRDISSLVDHGSYQLVIVKRVSEREEEILERIPLERGKTMDVFFRDVIYVKEPKEEGNCSLKYNTMTNYRIPKDEFDAYKQKYRGFCKGLIWYYEKETRLLVRVTGEAKRCLQDRKKSEKKEFINYRIELSIPEDVIQHAKICLAPNIRNDREEIEKLVKSKKGIQKLIDMTSPVQPSEYAGTIDFKFKASWCQNCSKNPEENKLEDL